VCAFSISRQQRQLSQAIAIAQNYGEWLFIVIFSFNISNPLIIPQRWEIKNSTEHEFLFVAFARFCSLHPMLRHMLLLLRLLPLM
jgi:hypothetical protein